MKKKRNSSIKRKFQIEKDAKNKAYHFILAYGLLGMFDEFCTKHKGENHYLKCVEILSSRSRR